MKAVVVDHLTKMFSDGKKALDNISISLEPGEVFGFLGPNGAGKTTTVKVLNGMLTSSEGSCRVFDIDPAQSPEKIHRLSGVMTEHAQMYDNLTGLQNLLFYAAVFGVSSGESEQRAESLLEKLNLLDAKDKKLASYSTGMRQRLSLARAMIHHPQVLFLDEPTSGLDPESAQSVNSLIRSLARDKGMSIFLCTHQLRYAQEICTSYGLIDNGSLLATGSLEQLRARVSSGMTVKLKASGFPSSLPHRKTGEQSFEMDIQSEEEIPPIVRRIVEEGGNVYHVSAQRPSLEDIYFELIEQRKGVSK
ncbi:ATP-binding cassette domain-containing protein [Paenibacillus sp. NPDC058071]|uniref:ABC transporter ATP-binding protein n=1 Tax=Paenibacillus sp. NPDC058071 TaxID=3346326 RepID=UPI0036DBEC6D